MHTARKSSPSKPKSTDPHVIPSTRMNSILATRKKDFKPHYLIVQSVAVTKTWRLLETVHRPLGMRVSIIALKQLHEFYDSKEKDGQGTYSSYIIVSLKKKSNKECKNNNKKQGRNGNVQKSAVRMWQTRNM